MLVSIFINEGFLDALNSSKAVNKEDVVASP